MAFGIGIGISPLLTDLSSGKSGIPPFNLIAPAITGTAQEGQTVTCSTGTWIGTPVITYTYQWKRNGSNIGSATNSTYTLVTADVGTSIKCTVTATNAISSVNADSNTVTPTSSTDPDAQAFITAAAITDPTQQSAINTLVTDLKGYSIWTKFKAIYPIVGGSASSHAVNLKTPGTFNLTFATGWTHSSTGMTPNGATFANTNCNILLNINAISHAFGVYSRTNNTTGGQVYGAYEGIPVAKFLQHNLSNGNFASGNLSQVISYTANPSTSLFIATRRTATDFQVYRAGISLGTNTTNSTGNIPSVNFYLGARNSPTAVEFYSSHQLAFAFLGDGLTDTDAANFYTAVNAYQVALSRNV